MKNVQSLSALSLLLLSLAGGLACAQSPAPGDAAPAAPEAAPAATPRDDAPLQADPQLHRGQLENGFRYIIRPTTEPRGQASMRLHVSIGSLNESEETKGISHFIEHMVFNGSRHFKNGELIPAMRNLGLGFGGDANAYTGMQQTVYTVDLPNLKPETVNFALTFLRDFADGAELADDAIERERGIIVSELRQRDSAASRAELTLMGHLVGGTRIPEYPPIGAESVILNCPPATIRQYYRDNYIPSRMTLIITGDIDPATAEQWVREHFATMEARPEPQRPSLGTLADTGAGSYIVPHAEDANCTITLAVVNPWTDRPDSLESRAASLPLRLACSMLDRRFSRLSRRADSPFLGASVVPRENVYGAAELFALRVTTLPGQWQEGFAAAEAELRRVLAYGFTQEEMMEAIAAINARCQKSMSSWNTITAASVAGRLLGTLDSGSIFTTPWEDARAYTYALRPILAKPSLCVEALAQAYEPGRAKLVMSGTIAEGVTPERLAIAYANARSTEVAPPQQEEVKPFAYGYIGEPGKVVAEQYQPALGVHCFTFSNGVRVNLRPMGAGMKRIYVSAAIDGGVLRLPRVAALREMIESVMSRSGLEAHSVEELSRLFMGKNVGCAFSMDDERFYFGGNTSPRDLEFQCKLLCAAILHPGFRSEGEVNLRRSLPTLFRKLETTPNGAFSKHSSLTIFGDDSRFVPPTPEQFEAVNADTVREVLTPFLQKGAIELTLVGDFKVDEVLPVLLGTFGAMPPREAEFSPLAEGARRVDFAPWGKRELIRYETELDKTIVAHVIPAGDGRDERRNRRLEVLRLIVAEKLFAAIRAEMGESYAPSMMLETRPGYENAATFTASSPGVMRNAAAVSAAMDRVFAALGRGEISFMEFQQVMRPHTEDVNMSYSMPPFWVRGMSRLQSEPRTLGLLADLSADVCNITHDEICKLAIEIFGDAGRVSRFLTVPQAYREAEAPSATSPAP